MIPERESLARHSSYRREAGGAQPPCRGDQIKQKPTRET